MPFPSFVINMPFSNVHTIPIKIMFLFKSRTPKVNDKNKNNCPKSIIGIT